MILASYTIMLQTISTLIISDTLRAMLRSMLLINVLSGKSFLLGILGSLVGPGLAATIIPPSEELDRSIEHTDLIPRNASMCGGESSLHWCGGQSPLNFCCSSGTTCLMLNTTDDISASICCPSGNTCTTISPILCDTALQSMAPSQIHVKPPQQPSACGDACCPISYTCQNGHCVADSPPQRPTSVISHIQTTSATTSSTLSTATGSAAATEHPKAAERTSLVSKIAIAVCVTIAVIASAFFLWYVWHRRMAVAGINERSQETEKGVEPGSFFGIAWLKSELQGNAIHELDCPPQELEARSSKSAECRRYELDDTAPVD